MRIAIVTLGRLSLLKLARELVALGHDVRVYSAIRRRWWGESGVPSKCFERLSGLTYLLAIAHRKAPELLKLRLEPLLQRVADASAAGLLGACDVMIGTAGFCSASVSSARKQQARVIMECPGHHVLAHKEMLESLPGARRPAISHFNLKRELWCYAGADMLVVPNQAAGMSYRARGIPADRIFCNLPGADLENFTSTSRPNLDVPTILYVGRWSVRKGCDLLGRAVDGLPWRVIHIGPAGDALPPRILRFEQRTDVPEWDMRQVYRNADVQVHASFEDPIDHIQFRGLASGLPLVCSDWSGGNDVRSLLDRPECLTVVPVGRLEELRRGLNGALERSRLLMGARTILESGRAALSWAAHAVRYQEQLRLLVPVLDAGSREESGPTVERM